MQALYGVTSWEDGAFWVGYVGSVFSAADFVNAVRELGKELGVELKHHRYSWNKSVRMIARTQVHVFVELVTRTFAEH